MSKLLLLIQNHSPEDTFYDIGDDCMIRLDDNNFNIQLPKRLWLLPA